MRCIRCALQSRVMCHWVCYTEKVPLYSPLSVQSVWDDANLQQKLQSKELILISTFCTQTYILLVQIDFWGVWMPNNWVNSLLLWGTKLNYIPGVCSANCGLPASHALGLHRQSGIDLTPDSSTADCQCPSVFSYVPRRFVLRSHL